MSTVGDISYSRFNLLGQSRVWPETYIPSVSFLPSTKKMNHDSFQFSARRRVLFSSDSLASIFKYPDKNGKKIATLMEKGDLATLKEKSKKINWSPASIRIIDPDSGRQGNLMHLAAILSVDNIADIMQWLDDEGVATNAAVPGIKQTALHRAAKAGNIKGAAWLLHKGEASLEEENKDGVTPLGLAILETREALLPPGWSWDIVWFFVGEGADIHKKIQKEGKSPYELANLGYKKNARQMLELSQIEDLYERRLKAGSFMKKNIYTHDGSNVDLSSNLTISDKKKKTVLGIILGLINKNHSTASPNGKNMNLGAEFPSLAEKSEKKEDKQPGAEWKNR